MLKGAFGCSLFPLLIPFHTKKTNLKKKEKKQRKRTILSSHFLTHHIKFCVIREFTGWAIQKTKLDNSWRTQIHVYATDL